VSKTYSILQFYIIKIHIIRELKIYRVSIKSFPDYKHLLQENYVEYKRSTC